MLKSRLELTMKPRYFKKSDKIQLFIIQNEVTFKKNRTKNDVK